MIIYGDGSVTRDYISVKDVARANLLSAISNKAEVCTDAVPLV